MKWFQSAHCVSYAELALKFVICQTQKYCDLVEADFYFKLNLVQYIVLLIVQYRIIYANKNK